jgi:hypothetical protein
VELVFVKELDEFVGWDNPSSLNEIALSMEYRHAWKDFFNSYTCPLEISSKSFKLASLYCAKIGLPFRWFLRWSIQLLGHFPQPWELNLHWLQEEVESIWIEVQDVKVLKGIDPSWQILDILKAHQS